MAKRRHNFKRIPLGHRLALAALLALTGGVIYLATQLVPAAHAQYRPERIETGPPVAIPNPEVTDHPNAAIPQDLEFTRSDGSNVKLADFFNHGRPVIFSMVYFTCPNLCGYVQDDLVNAIRSGPRSLQLGKDYEIVIVSIDPDDTPAAAEARRLKYLGIAGKPANQPGLTYLTGKEENIRRLADTLGFGYRRNFGLAESDPAGKFAHSAGIFVCTPFGRISQTIGGIGWPTDKLHAALVNAADGKIGSGFLETVAIPCGAVRLGAHGYEHNPWFWAGTAGGGATFAFMAIFLGVMWRGEWKRKRQSDITTKSALPGT